MSALPKKIALSGLLLAVCGSGLWGRHESDPQTDALGAFSRGENLSWDQLEVVATQAGMSKEQLTQIKLKDRLEHLIARYVLPLEISGFSDGMTPDEEFRLSKGRRPGWGALMLNAAFWSTTTGLYDTDAYLTYLLFRAEAYYQYRSHYDSEHCAWIVEQESPSMLVLRAALNGSQTGGVLDEGPPTDRDLEFRRSLDPTQNPSRTIKALTEYALRAVAQRAADQWAEQRYRKDVGTPPLVITDRIRQRERSLAADFAQARSAMTRAERLTFQALLKSPFRYAAVPGAPSADPVYDPAPQTTTRSVE